LIAKEGRPFREIIREICAVVNGPISAEVVAENAAGMIQEARNLADIHPNIVAKIPMTAEGLKAAKTLEAEHIRTNVTLVFTVALAAAAVCIGYVLISFYFRRGERAKGIIGLVLLASLLGYGLYNLDLNVLPTLSRPIAAFTVNAYLLSVLILFVSYYLVSRLMRSPLGAVMIAVRENDERTGMLGFDTFRYKLVTMGISGLFAGLAGAMLASLASFIITPDLMGATYTLNVLLYSILGGIGTLIGPILGAFIIQLLYFNIGSFSRLIGFPSLANWWLLIIGVFYIAVVLFLPYGLVWTIRLKGRSTLSRLRKALGGRA
jgi:transaldolase